MSKKYFEFLRTMLFTSNSQALYIVDFNSKEYDVILSRVVS